MSNQQALSIEQQRELVSNGLSKNDKGQVIGKYTEYRVSDTYPPVMESKVTELVMSAANIGATRDQITANIVRLEKDLVLAKEQLSLMDDLSDLFKAH